MINVWVTVKSGNVCPKLFFWGLRLKQTGHSAYLMKFEMHSDMSAMNFGKPLLVEEEIKK
jgi:hypothetical protein